MRAINWSDNRRKTGFVPVSKDNLYKSKISCPCFVKKETSAKRNCLIKSRKCCLSYRIDLWITVIIKMVFTTIIYDQLPIILSPSSNSFLPPTYLIECNAAIFPFYYLFTFYQHTSTFSDVVLSTLLVSILFSFPSFFSSFHILSQITL